MTMHSVKISQPFSCTSYMKPRRYMYTLQVVVRVKQASEVRAMDRFTADRCSFTAKFMNEPAGHRSEGTEGGGVTEETDSMKGAADLHADNALPSAFETLGLTGKKPQQSQGRGSNESCDDDAANHRVQSKGKRSKRGAQKAREGGSAEETSGVRDSLSRGHTDSEAKTQHITHGSQELSGENPSQGKRESDQEESGDDMIANRSSKGKRNKRRAQRSLGARDGSDDAAGEH